MSSRNIHLRHRYYEQPRMYRNFHSEARLSQIQAPEQTSDFAQTLIGGSRNSSLQRISRGCHIWALRRAYSETAITSAYSWAVTHRSSFGRERTATNGNSWARLTCTASWMVKPWREPTRLALSFKRLISPNYKRPRLSRMA